MKPQRGTKKEAAKRPNKLVKEASAVWRVFCAVELPSEARERLRDHVARLRKEVPEATASWSRVENIHLTLKFFGNVAVDRIPVIAAAASRAVREFSGFRIVIGNTGVFPKPSRAQVLWIGVHDPSGKLSALQKTFDDECLADGFSKEDRAYRPHLTIARLRNPEGARHLAAAHLNMTFANVEVPITEVVIFRSELSPKGSRYTALSHHRLPNP